MSRGGLDFDRARPRPTWWYDAVRVYIPYRPLTAQPLPAGSSDPLDRTPTTSSPAPAPAAHEGTMAGPPESPLQLSLPCSRRAPPRVSDGGRAEPARPRPGRVSAAAARLGTTHRGAAGAQDGGEVEGARRERARVLLLALLLRGRLHLHLRSAQQRAQRRPRCAHLTRCVSTRCVSTRRCAWRRTQAGTRQGCRARPGPLPRRGGEDPTHLALLVGIL
jgi:hypothetical protein